MIARNEGDRLKYCIASLAFAEERCVYVDSGSTDGSRRWATSRGIELVQYQVTGGQFCAAAARNVGFARVRLLWPDAEFVQFVDGDCEMDPYWLERGVAALKSRPDAAIVCGRVREKGAERSIYKRLCDMEFRTDPGETRACGGIFMIRTTAFVDVDGFDARLVAGEEPELCYRLRQRGWRIVRLADEMVLHESSMYCFAQWWLRMTRGGYAYALGRSLHGHEDERYNVRETRSIVLWTLGVVVVTGAAFAALGAVALVLLVVYAVQAARVARDRHRRGDRPSDALLYGVFCMIGKWAQLWGIARFWLGSLRGDRAPSFDYKTQPASGPGEQP